MKTMPGAPGVRDSEAETAPAAPAWRQTPRISQLVRALDRTVSSSRGSLRQRIAWAGLATTTVIALIDFLTPHLTLIGFLVIGPCLAVTTGRIRPTILVAAWSLVLAVALGAPDGMWDQQALFDYVVSVAFVGVVCSLIAAFHQIRTQDVRAHDDGDFVSTAFQGVLERTPNPETRAAWLTALRLGTPRADMLLSLTKTPEAAARMLYQPAIRQIQADFWRQRHDVVDGQRPVCFLHIMKTGGTTFCRVLSDLCGPWPRLTDLNTDQLLSLPRSLIEQSMFIAGHLPYEAIDVLPPGMALCTVLRDPVERTLSHHSHMNLVRAERGQDPFSVEEFVEQDTYRPLWENYQARQLFHRIGLADAWKTFAPTELAASHGLVGPNAEPPLQSVFDSTKLALAPDDLLVAAMVNLELIDFVGITDDPSGVVRRIAAFWGQTAVPDAIPRLRISQQRVQRAELPTAVLRRIERGTAVDAALYERACQINSET